MSLFLKSNLIEIFSLYFFAFCLALPCLAFGFAFELAFAWHCLTPPLHLNLHRLPCLALPCLALPCFAPPHPQFLCRCLVAFPMHMHEFAQDRLRASWLCPELLPGHRKKHDFVAWPALLRSALDFLVAALLFFP